MTDDGGKRCPKCSKTMTVSWEGDDDRQLRCDCGAVGYEMKERRCPMCGGELPEVNLDLLDIIKSVERREDIDAFWCEDCQIVFVRGHDEKVR